MSIAVARPVVTPEQLLAMPDAIRYELVDGELKERHVSSLSSWVGGAVYLSLSLHVRAERLGWVFPADNGFQCWPDSPKTLRRPDVSFVRLARLAAEDIHDGWLRVVPDLVVEVVSPNDLSYDLEQKLEAYFDAGVPLVWVVISPTRTVRVGRRDGSSVIRREGDELLGEDIVPGFRCRVAELFLPVPAQPATPPVG